MVREEDFLLSDQEILGGIRAAVERGESLKDAMMTFYQAGYDKFEIEEAARAYMNQNTNPQSQPMTPTRNVPVVKPEVKKEEEKKEEKKEEEKPVEPKVIKPLPKPIEPKAAPAAPIIPKPAKQKVSAYEIPKKKVPAEGNALTIFLVITLLCLIGILAAVFLFKDELVKFINGLFSFFRPLF